ncbi:MAG: redoxin family protein [Victivallales bacterium]|nr:redoxin family protein [Victivallales bacterium]
MKRLSVLICILLAFACFADEPTNWLKNSFGEKLIDAGGKEHDVPELKDKMVGIYFSAHWCPPCRQFTPKLVEFRDACAKENFEVVFVSCDHDDKAMKGYMTETNMKWLAVPFDSPIRKKLMNTYNVSGIPYLVILDKDGRIVSKNARMEVTKEGVKALKLWNKK